MTQDTQTTLPEQECAYFVVVNADDSPEHPAQIIGWQAVFYNKDEKAPAYTPPSGYRAYNLPSLTEEQWLNYQHAQNGCGGGLAYLAGDILDYTPPPIPLKDQAQAAMQSVQQQAAMVSAMGDTFGPQMRDYVKALRAIISGKDTTSTELPTAPDDATS